MWAWNLWGDAFGSVTGKNETGIGSTKLSVSALSNISMSFEKWLLAGYLLEVATNCAIL